MELVLTTILVVAPKDTPEVHVTVSVRVPYYPRVVIRNILVCYHAVYTECMQNPCRNQGTCRILAGSYTCICMPGYTGDFCEDGTVDHLIL